MAERNNGMNLISNIYDFLRKRSPNDLRTEADFRQARLELLSSTSLSDEEKTLLKIVSLRIHRDDGMYTGDGVSSTLNARHYLSVGLSAIQCIEDALDKSNSGNRILSILDFPSGYGRVLRFLRAKFPGARITASEIESQMLDFCKRAFFAKTVKSDIDFTKLSLPKFDLIWCGSLVTHLDEIDTTRLLKFFYNHLSPEGLCIFTAHGQFSVDSIQKKTITYGLTAMAQEEILSRFREKGYGYKDYSNQQGYGISVVSHEKMRAIAGNIGQWRETSFLERGWDNHQDVYGFSSFIQNE